MEIEVSVPALLADFTGGQRRFVVEADTVRGAVEQMLQAYPPLRRQLFEEDGKLRQHIVLFHNGEMISWNAPNIEPIEVGDTLQVLQAVSGG